MIEKNIESKAFNDFFVKTDSEIKNQVPGPDYCDKAIKFLNNYLLGCNSKYNNCKWEKIRVSNIFQCISFLSSSQSEDFYGFANEVIKEIIDVIAEPLVSIMP